MEITGKSISIDRATDMLEQGQITKEVNAGGVTAKWVRNSQGATSVLVQGLGEDFIELSAG